MKRPASDLLSNSAPTGPRPSVWLAEALGLLRKEWFLLLLRDGMLFTALVTAALAVDNSVATWRLWWPMPLALAAAVMTMALHKASPVRWRHLVNLCIFASPLAVRCWLSLHSAIPAAGLRECQELVLILFLGIVIWAVGSCHPTHALAVWTGAIAVGGWAMWPIGDRLTASNPFRVFTLISLGAGAITGLRLLAGLPSRGEDPQHHKKTKRFTVQYVLIDFLCLGFLGMGVVGGWMLAERQLHVPLAGALRIQQGLEAQRSLWLQSLLFGWGESVQDRLIRVISEPGAAVMPPWGGLVGALARGGVAGIAVLILWSLALNRQIRRTARAPYAQALSLPAALACFLMFGLLIGGAPHSRLATLVLGGWLGLALIKPIGRAAARTGHRRAPGPMPALLAALLLAGLAAVLALPTLGLSMSRSAFGKEKRFGLEGVRSQLFEAQGLNPFEPSIPAGIAETYRQAAGNDSITELTYSKVVRYYEDAIWLDPYDTLLPLRLANFQLQNDRQEEAIQTVNNGLKRRPQSQELLGWLYLVAERFNQNALADQVLNQALAARPSSTLWWHNQEILARRLGQIPLAEQALSVALTGNPETPRLVNSLFKAE